MIFPAALGSKTFEIIKKENSQGMVCMLERVFSANILKKALGYL